MNMGMQRLSDGEVRAFNDKFLSQNLRYAGDAEQFLGVLVCIDDRGTFRCTEIVENGGGQRAPVDGCSQRRIAKAFCQLPREYLREAG